MVDPSLAAFLKNPDAFKEKRLITLHDPLLDGNAAA